MQISSTTLRDNRDICNVPTADTHAHTHSQYWTFPFTGLVSNGYGVPKNSSSVEIQLKVFYSFIHSASSRNSSQSPPPVRSAAPLTSALAGGDEVVSLSQHSLHFRVSGQGTGRLQAGPSPGNVLVREGDRCRGVPQLSQQVHRHLGLTPGHVLPEENNVWCLTEWRYGSRFSSSSGSSIRFRTTRLQVLSSSGGRT